MLFCANEVLGNNRRQFSAKPVGVGAVFRRLIPTGEQSGLLTRIAPTAQVPPMLNSARRHCTSPRRGRRVEWSDQRPGIERLHFRPRLSCWRCASDAGYESVGNAGSIDVTTSDIPLRTDSVERCK